MAAKQRLLGKLEFKNANGVVVGDKRMSRGSTFATQICQVCAQLCQACGDECAKHEVEHCQRCAAACRRCAEECRRMTA